MNTKHIVVLIGPPGSGKGTQAGVVSRSLGMQHVNVGHLLRVSARSDGEVGGLLESGKPLPAACVDARIREVLDLTRDGWIFDGYPRSIEQYEQSFLPLLRYISTASEGCSIRVKVVYLEFPSDGLLDLYKRIATRYECCVCGTPFSYQGGCKEQCGCADLSTFAFRMDDDYGMFCKRIHGFNEAFAGLGRAFQEDFQEDYHVVRADQAVMAVSGDVMKCLHF